MSEIQIHLAAKIQEIEEAKYRVSLKHQIKEAGVPYDRTVSTADLEKMVDGLV